MPINKSRIVSTGPKNRPSYNFFVAGVFTATMVRNNSANCAVLFQQTASAQPRLFSRPGDAHTNNGHGQKPRLPIAHRRRQLSSYSFYQFVTTIRCRFRMKRSSRRLLTRTAQSTWIDQFHYFENFTSFCTRTGLTFFFKKYSDLHSFHPNCSRVRIVHKMSKMKMSYFTWLKKSTHENRWTGINNVCVVRRRYIKISSVCRSEFRIRAGSIFTVRSMGIFSSFISTQLIRHSHRQIHLAWGVRSFFTHFLGKNYFKHLVSFGYIISNYRLDFHTFHLSGNLESVILLRSFCCLFFSFFKFSDMNLTDLISLTKTTFGENGRWYFLNHNLTKAIVTTHFSRPAPTGMPKCMYFFARYIFVIAMWYACSQALYKDSRSPCHNIRLPSLLMTKFFNRRFKNNDH